MDATRYLLVIADDFGIGPETTRAILELAARGAVTGSVLLVNSPHAEAAVAAWRRAGRPVELGWHPNLTLDAPVCPPRRVPSLVGPGGRFWPLGAFLRRALWRRLRAEEIETELRAQYRRFVELVGRRPALVNAHQHAALFRPVGDVLLELLRPAAGATYFRRVREPWRVLASVPGARLKRAALNFMGRRYARAQRAAGFPGADWIAGVADPAAAPDDRFFSRWLARVPGRSVELMCHPGHPDPMLGGRDGLLGRRADEHRLLARPEFDAACRRAGFARVPPSWWLARLGRGHRHAA
jgi:predicted glycoside hydrolase/deacetylase ChbG (UPF0249 family)